MHVGMSPAAERDDFPAADGPRTHSPQSGVESAGGKGQTGPHGLGGRTEHALGVPESPGTSLSRTIAAGSSRRARAARSAFVLHHQKHLGPTWMLAERGCHRGAGLIPAPPGVGADDDVYVQTVTADGNGLPGRGHTAEPTSCAPEITRITRFPTQITFATLQERQLHRVRVAHPNGTMRLREPSHLLAAAWAGDSHLLASLHPPSIANCNGMGGYFQVSVTSCGHSCEPGGSGGLRATPPSAWPASPRPGATPASCPQAPMTSRRAMTPTAVRKVGIAGQAVWPRNSRARAGLRATHRSVGAIWVRPLARISPEARLRRPAMIWGAEPRRS